MERGRVRERESNQEREREREKWCTSGYKQYHEATQ